MTLYIISYTCYDAEGIDDLQTEHYAFTDFDLAQEDFQLRAKNIREDFRLLLDENDEDFFDEKKYNDFAFEFMKYNPYIKTILELTEHEI